MKYNLIKEGAIARTHDFGDDTPPVLAAHKGKWLPVVEIDPPYDPETENRTLSVTIGASDVTHEYIVTPKSQAELDDIEAEGDLKQIRSSVLEIAFIQIELIDKLLEKGTIVANDFTAPVKQRFLTLKGLVDKHK